MLALVLCMEVDPSRSRMCKISANQPNSSRIIIIINDDCLMEKIQIMRRDCNRYSSAANKLTCDMSPPVMWLSFFRFIIDSSENNITISGAYFSLSDYVCFSMINLETK